jgi:SAM-dependent methyltransferase
MLPQFFHEQHSHYNEDIPFWLELAAHTSDPVLELGCGTGRVLIPLAQAGHQTIGLDHDLAMLKYLQGSIEAQVQPCPVLIAADISRFKLAAQFQLIILPCNTFSTLPDKERQASLSCIRRHLKPGGLFVVSVPNPELLKDLPAKSGNELEDEFLHPLTGNPVQVSSSWRRKKRTFTVTWIYDQILPDGTVERLTVETIHQMIPVDTYIADIQAAGMGITGIYGDFDRSAYTADSAHLIILATG